MSTTPSGRNCVGFKSPYSPATNGKNYLDSANEKANLSLEEDGYSSKNFYGRKSNEPFKPLRTYGKFKFERKESPRNDFSSLLHSPV